MSTVRRAAQNLSSLFFAQLFTRISGLVVTALLARHLGGEYFGHYTLAISFASLFSVLAGLGMRHIVIRHIIHHPELAPRTLGSAVVSYAVQSIVTILVIVSVAKILGYEGRKFYGIVLMSLSVAFMAYESLFYAVMEAHERMNSEAILILLRQAVWIGLATIALFRNEGYLVFLMALLASGAFAAFGAGFVVYRRFFSFPFALHGPTASELIRAGLPVAGAAILVDMYLKVDMVMIDQMIDETAVGSYGASYRLVQALLFLSGTFFTVIYPIFNRLQRDNRQKLFEAHERSVKMISLVLVPASAGMSVLSLPIMRNLFGEEFTPGAEALVVAAWGVALFGLAVVMGRLLLSLSKQRIIFLISLASLIFNILMNLLLIPRMGIQGAALASVLTIGGVAVLNWWAVAQHFGKYPPLISILWKIYAAALGMIGVVWMIRDYRLWFSVPIGAICYFLLIWLLRVLDEKDWSMIQHLWRRGRVDDSPESPEANA